MRVIESFTPELTCQMPLSLFVHSLYSGSDSSGEDDVEMDLNQQLITSPRTMFYARVNGEGFPEQGVFDGDLLVVDRAVKPQHGHLVAVSMDGELFCGLLDLQLNCLRGLLGGREVIELEQEAELHIVGVVLHSVRHHGRYL